MSLPCIIEQSDLAYFACFNNPLILVYILDRYTAGEPKNLPDLYFGPNGINLGGLLAWEFCLMHWVEVRRWQDYKKPGSVNEVRWQRSIWRLCLWTSYCGVISARSVSQEKAAPLRGRGIPQWWVCRIIVWHERVCSNSLPK